MSMLRTFRNLTAECDYEPVKVKMSFLALEDEGDGVVLEPGDEFLPTQVGEYGMSGLVERNGGLYRLCVAIYDIHCFDFGELDARNQVPA